MISLKAAILKGGGSILDFPIRFKEASNSNIRRYRLRKFYETLTLDHDDNDSSGVLRLRLRPTADVSTQASA
jgi:hypothetical protein